MADDEGDACTLAVRMATGGAYSDEQIRNELVTPLLERVRAIKSQAGGMDDAAAFDKASAELARQKLKATMFAAKTKYLREKTDVARRTDVAKRLEQMKPIEVGQSVLIGSGRRAHGAENSIELNGLQRGEQFTDPFFESIKQVDGLFERISSPVLMRGEAGFPLDVARQVARLNSDSAIEGGAGDDPVGEQITHTARAAHAMLDAILEEGNAAGADNERYPGYIGRIWYDPLLVSGGFWVHQAAAWKQAIEDVKALRLGDDETKARLRNLDFSKAQIEAEKMGFQPFYDHFMGIDRGGVPRVLPSTFADTLWEDLAPATSENDYTLAPEKAATDEEWKSAERDAKARAFALEKHLQGVFRSANDPKELLLYHMWTHIVNQSSEVVKGAADEKDFTPTGGNLGLRISKSKSIHYASLEDEFATRAKYSSTPYFAGLVQQANRAGHNIALMERLGPETQRGFEDLRAQLHDAAKTNAERRTVMGSALQVPWEMVNGAANVPVSMREAEVGKNLRAAASSMKMGAVLLSKPADWSFAAQSNIRAGMGALRANSLNAESLAKLADPEMRSLARGLGAGVRNATGRLLNAHTPGDARPGLMSRLVLQSHRLSAFTIFNHAVESMAVLSHSSILGENLAKGTRWDDIAKPVRERLDDFGIQPHDWDLVLQARKFTGDDGSPYFATDPLDELAQERPELQQDIYRTKALFKSYFVQARRMALNEPGLRQAMAARAPFAGLGLSGPVLRPGTFWGEMATSVMQFKGFVGAALTRHLVPAIQQAARGNAGPLAHLIVSTTIAGYIGMQLKAVSRGEQPRMPTDLGDATKIVLAAMAQGGGLGLYGDFLFGDMDRSGAEFGLESVSGPVVGTSVQVLKIFLQAIHGGGVSESTGRSIIPGELVHLASQNIPVINTWYTRLALDYLVLWRLQEMASPGYLARYQQQMEQKDKAHYWLGPESPSPYH